MPNEAILNKAFIWRILKSARTILTRDGEVYPVLCLAFQEGKALYTPCELVDEDEQKRAYFSDLGRSLRQKGMRLAAALLIGESGFVDAQKHKGRQEALIIVGRNAENSRDSCVVQLIERDGEGQPVLGPMTVERYNRPCDPGNTAEGFLDLLFAEAGGGSASGTVRL